MLQYIKSKCHIFLELLALLIMSFTPLIWFDPQKIVIGLDSGYPINFIEYFWQRSFTWLSSMNFGTDMTTFMGLVPFHGIQAFFAFLHIPFYSVEKVTFVMWFFVMSLSIYLFIHYLYPKREYWMLRLTTVIVYLFNLYIFSFWLNGEQTTFSVYALLPLLILILLRFLRREVSPLRAALYFNLIYFFLSAGGITGVPLLGSPIVAIVLTITILFLLRDKNTPFYFLKRLSLLLFCIFPFFIILNAYWLIPFLANFRHEFATTVAGNGGVGGNISWINFISKYTSYINLFRLQGDNNWYEHPGFYSNTYFTNPLFIVGSYLLPMLAYSAILFVNDKREKIIVLLFITFSLAGIFLSAGSHDPFGFIYIFMMNHIPGFIAFRSAYYKFVIINYFAYSVLIGISVYYLLHFLKSNVIRNTIWCIFIVLFLVYNYPFFQKSNFVFHSPFTTMIKIPSYVFSFRDYEHNKKEYRTLVVPALNKDYPLYVYSWGYYGTSPIFPLLTRNSFVYNNSGLFSGTEKSLLNYTYEYLISRQYDQFLEMTRILDIHDILLTEDIVANYGFSFTESPQVYKNAIESSHLFHVVWQAGPWTLYSLNQEQSPKIFTSSNFDTYQGDPQNLPLIISRTSTPFVSQIQDISVPLFENNSNQIVRSFSCISCALFGNAVKPEMPITYILPDSFIYQLKEWKERKNLGEDVTPEIKIPLLLQSLLKHTGELSELIQGHPQDLVVTQWQAETKPLSDYLGQIDNEIPYFASTNNFPLLQQIDTYISTVNDNTIEMYNITHEKYDPNLQTAITDLLGREKNVLNNIESVLSSYFEEKSYSFDISSTYAFQELSIPLVSLPTNLQGMPIMPSKYTLDEKDFAPSTSIENSQLVFSGIPKNSHILTLHFDSLANLAANAKEKPVSFPDGIRNCMVVPLPNYSWRDIYNISVNNTMPIREGDVYVSAEYPQRAGLLENDNSSFVHYVQNFHFIFENSSTKRMLFYGNQDYTGAVVYFCPKFPEEIGNLSNDISVVKLIQPSLYGISKNSLSADAKENPDIVVKNSNPTEYEVSIQHASTPYLLTFLESYSGEWKLYDIHNKEIIVPHVMVDGYANGWYIDKTGNYTLYIRFVTQQLFITGVWVSLASLILVSLLTGYIILSRKLRKV